MANQQLGRIQLIVVHLVSIAFSKISSRVPYLLGLILFAISASPVRSQDNAAGPLQPPPEHNVTRVVGIPEPEAPPSLPPEQIILRFSKKEETYQEARPTYSYRKTIRIQEFGPDGKPTGEFSATYDGVRSSDGKLYEKALAAPETSLQYLQFEPEDAQILTRIPAYPVVESQLSKYNVQYLSTEKVDEIDCYIFQVSPKTVERQRALFDGVIWVDQKYLEVVKTYGRWVTDQGALHPPSLPFDMFETYRENVDGKYWFPNYSRSDGTYKLKDRDVPIRVTVKWTNFKPYPPLPAPSPSPSATPPASSSPPPSKP